MKRRDFLKVSAVGAAATAVASPAIAQSSPEIKWRLTSSFPKSLDTIYGGAEQLSKYVAEMTDNKFQIQVFAAGEVVPGPAGARCHLKQHRRDVSHRFLLLCRQGSDVLRSTRRCRSASTRASRTPGGTRAAAMELGNEFFKKFGVIGFPCGNTGTQMGGWFRKEIKTVADLSGLKMRIGGIAGQVLAEGRRRAAAARRRRHLSGAGKRHHRCGRVGRSRMTTKSSASPRLRSTTTIPASGKAVRPSTRSATSRSGIRCRRTTRRSSPTRLGERQHLDERALRHAQPDGVEASGWPAARSCVPSPTKCWKPASRRPTNCGVKSRPRTPTSRSRSTRCRPTAPTSICGGRLPNTPSTAS